MTEQFPDNYPGEQALRRRCSCRSSSNLESAAKAALL